MRSIYPFFSYAASAAMAALSFCNVFSGRFQEQVFLPGTPTVGRRQRRVSRPATRRRTGALYPHSSTRQQARYARQLAAGQLSMTIVEKRV